MKAYSSKVGLLILLLTLVLTACSSLQDDQRGPTIRSLDEIDSLTYTGGQFPPASIRNDEGGPISVTGELTYTNPFFTAGTAEPLVILEDQAGFIDRDRNYIFPVESQVLGQITTDYYTSPFSYTLTLPETPSGPYRDVDLDSEEDNGVQVYAVAYWTNVWGDPYLEKRDQHGGGWSSAYASSLVSDDRANYLEVYGGKYLLYSPDSEQGFPAGFGEDGLLFTEDDPIIGLPAGWTLVDLDSDPFVFDRSSYPTVDLLEPEGIALDDFSDLGYSDAFEAMLEKMRTEYAFTENKSIEWEKLESEFRPRFEQAEANRDSQSYLLALRDFLWSIPDGHIAMDTSVFRSQFQAEVAGGLGMALRQLDDGRVLVNYVLPAGPAEEAGIQLGAEILTIEGQPIQKVLEETIPWSSPFSTDHTQDLEQLRYAIRFPLGSNIEVGYSNPEGTSESAVLSVVQEYDSFDFSSPYKGVSGFELPVEFEILDEGYGYVKIASFFDNEVLTIQLWERMMQDLNENGVPGLIIDMRNNGGGSGFLADQMAAYFFEEELASGNTGFYDDSTGEFYTDPGDEDLLFPPPREELRYAGPVVVLVGPACASACEFFSYDLTLQDRATIVGQYPTAGLGGSVEDFVMPEDNSVRFTIGRAVDPAGEIHIEGIGVVPSERVPVTEENMIAQDIQGRDIILEEAIKVLSQSRSGSVPSEGNPRIASILESRNALQSQTPLLEDLASDSELGDPINPTTSTFTIPMAGSQDVIWASGWCAAPENLEQNLENIEFRMSVNGEDIDLERFAGSEFESGDQACLFYYVLVTDWPQGGHVLQSILDFETDIDDGIIAEPYPAGERIVMYLVDVEG